MGPDPPEHCPDSVRSRTLRTDVAAQTWWVYVLCSSSRRTYVGVTNDLSRRLAQHNGELPGGAKSTRAGRPWTLGAQFGPFATRADAQRIEYRVKRRRGAARLESFDTSAIAVEPSAT